VPFSCSGRRSITMLENAVSESMLGTVPLPRNLQPNPNYELWLYYECSSLTNVRIPLPSVDEQIGERAFLYWGLRGLFFSLESHNFIHASNRKMADDICVNCPSFIYDTVVSVVVVYIVCLNETVSQFYLQVLSAISNSYL